MDQRKGFATFFLIFAALVVVRAYKPEVNSYSSMLLIDCGSSDQSNWSGDELYKWETDEQFIQTGENKILPSNQTAHEMNSLRFFPEGHKNCYKVPFQDGYQNRKYIFRAGFYYGNYDGLLNPPSFGLEIDGFFWANVTTSTREEPVYHEMLYMRKGLTTTICLVRMSEEDGIPFISSIEAIETYNRMYNLMNNKTAFHLQSRINYGANQSVEQSITPSEDLFARIWKSKEMPNYLNIHSQRVAYGRAYSENYPPWKVMDYAIQAKNVTDSLYLPLNFSSQTLLQAYIVLYFMDPIVSQLPSKICNVEIYIDGIKMATTDIPNGFSGDEYRVVSLFPVAVVGGSANLTISPLEGSTLAPILNAMEVYSASDVSKGGNLFINFPVLFLIVFLQLICFLVL